MESHDGFRFRTSYAARRQMAEFAYTMLALRANTPPGEWVHEHYGYGAVFQQARELAGNHPHDDVLLSVLNLADVLRFLVAATGMEQEQWLGRLHADYIAPIDPDRTGVWGPEELTL